jgi:cytochrome d ubiquinol oxidase subunit I
MVVTYWSFRIMVGLGAVLLFASAFAALTAYLKFTPRLMKYLKWMPYLIPAPFIAGVAGWITTEMGRQPWIVQGLLTTAQGVSPNLTVTDVSISLVGFVSIYVVLSIIMFRLMYRFARQGTEAALKKSVDVELPNHTNGTLIPVGVQD